MKNNTKTSLISLLNKIDMPQEVCDAILDCLEGGNESHPKEEPFPGINVLAKHLITSVDSRENGKWKRFPEDIFTSTMGCFSRFVKEHYVSYGYYGFDRDFWTTRQMSAHLFRIGELEYELIDDDKEHIHIHIPSDAKMLPDLLNKSIEDARAFLNTYFPERKNNSFALESWLLSPVLKELLPQNSKILMFQEAFDVTEVFPDEKDYIAWIFQLSDEQIKSAVFSELPEKTTLQKNTKKLLLEGGNVGSASGILCRSF